MLYIIDYTLSSIENQVYNQTPVNEEKNTIETTKKI